MKNARPLLLAASTVALLISACSQAPANLEGPTLALQFGTADSDYASSVDLGSNGMVYVGANRNYYRGSEDDLNVTGTELDIRQYDSAGNQSWKKTLRTAVCSADRENCASDRSGIVDVHTDSQGNVYALTSFSYYNFDDYPGESNALYKLDKTGVLLWSNDVSIGNAPSDAVSLWVDTAGNAYVARTDNSDAGGGAYGNHLTKYTSGGRVAWEVKPGLGTLRDVVVSSSGSIYVVGSAGLARYTNSGGLTWTKSGGGDDITISGSSLYVCKGTTIRRHDSTGKQLWAKTQSGLPGLAIADITGDGSGNVYLAGKYSATSTNRDAFTRKLSSSGTVVWTKPFGTAAYDEALGIATLTGSEIYTTGSTNGALSHANMGGSDAYLRKTNSNGDRVWTR